jgi:nucleoside-diphosphate-sugar epimerase
MKVLITGTEGYIGARMAPILAAAGHEVVGLDTGFYRDGCLYLDSFETPCSPRTLYRDIRHITARDLDGFDAVVHLAELSNDPLGKNNPNVTFEINHQGSVRLAQLAKQAGVGRFVYASSCSVYGVGDGDGIVDESTPTNPQTPYAHCKVNVERDLSSLADGRFCVTFLRNATAYGPSPRMRFDIVLNDLCARAFTRKRIEMTSDGTPWRPIVHIEDIIQAVKCTLDAEEHLVNSEIFNVGSSTENYRVRDIAEIVSKAFPGCSVSSGPQSGDNRSYRVSFEKITTKLPGYSPIWTAARGAEELHALFRWIEFDESRYEFRAFTRLKQLNYLQRTGQLDDRLYWRPRCDSYRPQ